MRFFFISILSLFCLSAIVPSVPDDFVFKVLYTRNPCCFLESPVDRPFAIISKIGETFIYTSMSGEVMSKSVFSTSSSKEAVEIRDQRQNLIGTITRETYALFPAKYDLLNAKGALIATGTMNWLSTRLTLQDSEKKRDLVTFYRPFFRLPGDYWYVSLEEEKLSLDPRFIVMLGIYQSEIDFKKSGIWTIDS